MDQNDGNIPDSEPVIGAWGEPLATILRENPDAPFSIVVPRSPDYFEDQLAATCDGSGPARAT